jgi:predicted NBD/HSP70 family sugar kinase
MDLISGPAIPGNLRQMNRLTVLRALRASGPTTIPAIATQTGISRPTVAKVIGELEDAGLAAQVGRAPIGSTGGKPGTLHRFNASGVRSGAVFLRVDTVQVAIMDGNARVLARAEHPLGGDRRPEPVLALIVEALTALLQELALQPADLLGIGVGVPGITSYHTGVIHLAPHLPEWSEVPLGALLAQRMDVAVWIDNDCHVQALAERHFGRGQDVQDFVSVQSGIGLSAAFYFDGDLYRGHADTAGEIGHMIVEENGQPCVCGSRGCWETIASTTRLVDDVCQMTDGSWALPPWLLTLAPTAQACANERPLAPDQVTALARVIFQAAHIGQPEAVEAVTLHAQRFGIGLCNLVNIVNPRRIIIWGESLAGGELFLVTVRAWIKKNALSRPRASCEVVFSSLKHDVGLIGAGTLAIDALFEGTFTERM